MFAFSEKKEGLSRQDVHLTQWAFLGFYYTQKWLLSKGKRYPFQKKKSFPWEPERTSSLNSI